MLARVCALKAPRTPNNAPRADETQVDSFSVVFPDLPAAEPSVGSYAIRPNSLLRYEHNANTTLHFPSDTITMVQARNRRDGLTKCLAIDMYLLRSDTGSHSSRPDAGIRLFELGRRHALKSRSFVIESGQNQQAFSTHLIRYRARQFLSKSAFQVLGQMRTQTWCNRGSISDSKILRKKVRQQFVIGIQERDTFRNAFPRTAIAGSARSGVCLLDNSQPWIGAPGHHFHATISRAVIHNDHLVILETLREYRFQRACDKLFLVVERNNHAHDRGTHRLGASALSPALEQAIGMLRAGPKRRLSDNNRARETHRSDEQRGARASSCRMRS